MTTTRIRLSAHARDRLLARGIDEADIRRIIQNPAQVVRDPYEGTYHCYGRAVDKYARQERYLVVIYANLINHLQSLLPCGQTREACERMALVTYDPDAKAMYVSLEDKKVRVARSIPLGEGKYLDVTESNEPVGLEIILPRTIPAEAVDAIVNHGKSKIALKR